jgi:hypothetical protein
MPGSSPLDKWYFTLHSQNSYHLLIVLVVVWCSCGFWALVGFYQVGSWNSNVREEWLSMDSLCRYCLRYVMARADAAEAYVQVKVLAVAAVLLKRGWWVQFSVAFLWLGSFINHHKTRFIHAGASVLLKRVWWVQFSVAFPWLGSSIKCHMTSVYECSQFYFFHRSF